MYFFDKLFIPEVDAGTGRAAIWDNGLAGAE
jgi:hypothetical protein